jgi:hypothetical protein
VIVIGQLTTADGTAWSSTVELSASGRGATEYRHLYQSPAIEYRSTQPSHIGVDLNHSGRQIGEVVFLSQKPLGLYCVAELDDDGIDDLPFPMYLSSELEGHYERGVYHDIVLHSVAVVPSSAIVAKTPALIVAGDTLELASLTWNNPHRPLLAEAHQYCQERRYRARQPHRIAGARTVEHVSDGLSVVDGEPVFVRKRGPFITTPDGHTAELEYSAHRGRILSVR